MSTEAQQMYSSIQFEYLQNKIATLENQLQQTITNSRKKEAYAITLENDLEHIIIQLKRLEVVKHSQ